MKLSIAFVGFGNVGRRVVRLLEESRAALSALGVEPVVVGIATKRHGAVFDPAGVDAEAAARAIEQGGALGPASTAAASLGVIESLGREVSGVRVLIETTVLDIRAGEPATSHVRAGFAAGAHVITANKGPVAFRHRALNDEAARAGVSFLFEGAVMDGIPIFNLVRESMPAVTVHGFRGVVNSTTNHMLCAVERGESFDGALARMQAAGVAEADPSLDVDGWDAAAKTAALANVLMDADLTPQAVRREGLTSGCGERARAAMVAGRRLKLVARASRHGDRLDAAVGLEELDASDPLAQLDGQANALEFDTTPLGRIVITQRDGGLEKTAYALVTDLVTVARRIQGRA